MYCDLPPEIWLEILETIRDDEEFYQGSPTQATYRSPTVHNISLVSRYFRHLALRIIFSELTWNISSPIDPEAEENEEEPKSRENVRRCGELLLSQTPGQASPDLRTMVHTLRIFGESAQKSIDTVMVLDVWTEIIEKVVPMLKNLHTLALTFVPITLPLFDAVWSLPDLANLAISDCTIWKGDLEAMSSDGHLEGRTGLAVRRLRLELQPWYQVTPQTTEAIEPRDPIQDDMIRKVLRTFISGGRSGRLRSLALNHITMDAMVRDLKEAVLTLPSSLNAVKVLIRWPQEDSDTAVELFRHCSAQVEDIEITLQRVDRTIPIPLPSDALPNLAVYRGAWGCAEEFISGRPVHSIYIDRALQARETPVTGFTRADTEGLLKIIATGTVPVRHLRFGVLSWKATVLSVIADLFPQLETLRVDDRGPLVWEDWKKDDGTKYIQRLTKLRVARITVTKRVTDDLDEQRRVVTAWASANPSLRVIWLTRWQRWTRCEDGVWTVAQKKITRTMPRSW